MLKGEKEEELEVVELVVELDGNKLVVTVLVTELVTVLVTELVTTLVTELVIVLVNELVTVLTIELVTTLVRELVTVLVTELVTVTCVDDTAAYPARPKIIIINIATNAMIGTFIPAL